MMKTNAYYFDKEGAVHEALIPPRHGKDHWETIRYLLGGDGVMVRPASHLERTHGLIYVDEEGMWKHPVNASLTVCIDITEMFYGPAVIMKKPIDEVFESKIRMLLPSSGEYEFFKEEE